MGTGFSYVDDHSALVKTDKDAATDLTTLLKALYNSNPKMQSSPLFVVAESYGGKYAVTLGLSVIKAIKTGELKLKFGGIDLFAFLRFCVYSSVSDTDNVQELLSETAGYHQ